MLDNAVANATTIFSGGVSMLLTFTDGTATIIDVIFAGAVAMVALAVISFAKRIVM